MTSAATKPQPGPGRPRGFDEAEVLHAALELFWRQGYEATSLDELTAAMGISRSSFYATFGSKHGVLVAAMTCYTDAALAALAKLTRGDAADAVPAMLKSLANPKGGPKGCLLVNCITELAPHCPDVAALGRRHFAKIVELFAGVLSPDDPARALDRARALTALALGTVTLRKSGTPPEQIDAALDEARVLLTNPI